MFLWTFMIVFAARKIHARVYASPERTTKQITLTPDQIKKAVCEGMTDANGTYYNCWVYPVGSKL
jgi:hypothetical protein